MVFTATLTQSMHFESTKLRRQKSFCSSLSLQDWVIAIFEHKEPKNLKVLQSNTFKFLWFGFERKALQSRSTMTHNI